MSGLPADAPAWAWPLYPLKKQSTWHCNDAIARRPFPEDGNLHLSSDVVLRSTARLDLGRSFGVMMYQPNSAQESVRVGRKYYLPTAEDVSRVRAVFPDLLEPENPNWLQVGRKLRGSGYRDHDLAGRTAPELLDLLGPQVAPSVAEITRPPESPPATTSSDDVTRLLRVFTDGIADDRIRKAAQLLGNGKLTVNEKLTKIDELIPLPAIATAEQLAEMLGVTKQAVLKTDWWVRKRKGETENDVDDRRERHRKRAKGYESPGQEDDG
jgi:hypothetical protein